MSFGVQFHSDRNCRLEVESFTLAARLVEEEDLVPIIVAHDPHAGELRSFGVEDPDLTGNFCITEYAVNEFSQCQLELGIP